jgi:hypothetical protein
MRGVHFVTDAEGKKVAVQLDLEEWGELWEDIYDAMTARERMGEPTVPLEEVGRDLRERGLLDE